LLECGLEPEYLRWWDTKQRGDILFHFGRPPIALVRFAKSAGLLVVAEHVLTGLVSRPSWKRAIQKRIISTLRSSFHQAVSDTFSWDSFELVDMNFFPSAWDASVACHMFNVKPEKSYILPYGANDAFLLSAEVPRDSYLITTSTITPRKRVVELATACHLAGVPLKVVGKPYAMSDQYFERFRELARSSQFIEHIPHIADQVELANLYRRARGFVLLSAMETISQSAIEAAACRTPLLLSDMDWAHRSFGKSASYCPVTNSTERTATAIRSFYERAPELAPEWKPPSWQEARGCLRQVFEDLLREKTDFILAASHM
jgi:glycosyltransferase involved in cell wall biosynthesis